VRERIAFTTLRTTVSSYPTMPGNYGRRSRSPTSTVRAAHLSRRRGAETLCSERTLRNSPRVRATLNDGNPQKKQPYAIIPPHRLLFCQMSCAEERYFCCGTETLQPGGGGELPRKTRSRSDRLVDAPAPLRRETSHAGCHDSGPDWRYRSNQGGPWWARTIAANSPCLMGLLPRANRGIFAINELPDLAGRFSSSDL